MKWLSRTVQLLVLVGFLGRTLSQQLQPNSCPPGLPIECSCKPNKNRLWKVKCSGKLEALTKLDLSSQASLVSNLDLSSNGLIEVGTGYFQNFSNLKRLDLSNNSISILQDDTFKGLQNLNTLKISYNSLSHLSKEAFLPLSSLKKLDISNNSLECSCAQTWLLDWAWNISAKINNTINVSPVPKCASPIQEKGLSFLQWYNRTSCAQDILRIYPQQNQVVFEGDRLSLQCEAFLAGLDSPSISWFWGKQDPSSVFKEVHLDSVNISGNGTLWSSLNIDHLTSNHSGQWNCLLLSGQANHSRTVSVLVISEKEYCPQTITKSNKGIYMWPQKNIGLTAELPCEADDLNSEPNSTKQYAHYECGSDGQWHSLNTSLCPYASETTQLLQGFSKMNLSIHDHSKEHGRAIVESAQSLLNLSCGSSPFSDKMDAIFLSKAISNYLKFLPKQGEVGPLLIDMVSCVIPTSRKVLRAAQQEEQACSRLVHAVETIAAVTNYSSSSPSPRETLAVQEFRVSHERFLGITCVWYSVAAGSGPNVGSNSQFSKEFYCADGNNSALLSSREEVIEASIQIPPSLFYHLESQGKPVLPTHQLIISMYENSHLFPRLSYNDSTDRWDVASSVIGAKLVGINVQNLKDPVHIVVQAPSVQEAGGWARPVWWDEEMNSGTGGWSEQGCTRSHLMHGKLYFHCDRFGYFGLLQEMPFEFIQSRYPRTIWQLAHPAIYIGSSILILSLIVSIVTYVVAGPHIQMPKRTKHALINTWIAIALLSFMFSFGVRQTDDAELCQSIGIILHYLTLSTLLWMAVTVSNMHTSLKKKNPLEMGSEDDLPTSTNPPPKPLLGLYLVGWGIGLMVVGVSGAVNLKQYRYIVRDEYCFLVPNSALGAVLVPCAAVIVYLLVCVLLVRCDISQRQADTNAQLSDGTQGTENVDLDLLDCTVPARPGIGSFSVGSTVSSEVEDAEHAPATQLRATLIVLLLFCSLWAAGAFATASQLHGLFPHAQLVYSTFYAVTAFLLSAFILFFHCFARSDVRPCWRRSRCRSPQVSGTRPSTLPQTPCGMNVKTTCEVPVVDKVSNLDRSLVSQVHGPASNHVSSSTSLNSNKSHNQRAAVELNKTVVKPSLDSSHDPQKDSNLHLMPIYRSYPSVIDAEVFYNPRQSDMARKFFRKQKRHATCSQNQANARRIGDGEGNQSDMESSLRDSLKGSGSKVSNTNIHVEQHINELSSNHAHSCNILAGENLISSNNERWVVGADSSPVVNNDGTVKSEINGVSERISDRNSSRRRRSRGVRDVNSPHDRPREKYQNFTRNGTMSSMSSVRSRDVEMEGDFMRVSVVEESHGSIASKKSPIYPWDNGSVVSGASFSLERASETENDVCSVSQSSRRNSRSPNARKRYKRPDPPAPRSHPTSLASSIVSLPSRDTNMGIYPGMPEAKSPTGSDMNSTISKKETCV